MFKHPLLIWLVYSECTRWKPLANTEGAKFWMKVLNDLKTRGVEDILIAATDGLKGTEEALEAVYPKTTLQTCIVHLIRNSLYYVGWTAALMPIYTAPNAEAAKIELDNFESGNWGQKLLRRAPPPE